MSARVGLSSEEYEPLLAGTRLLRRGEAGALYEETEGFDSLHGSTNISNDFNLRYEVYRDSQDLEAYIDSSFTIGK
jgi:NitT/TauT family transport system substrate-binding protein